MFLALKRIFLGISSRSATPPLLAPTGSKDSIRAKKILFSSKKIFLAPVNRSAITPKKKLSRFLLAPPGSKDSFKSSKESFQLKEEYF